MLSAEARKMPESLDTEWGYPLCRSTSNSKDIVDSLRFNAVKTNAKSE